jgi:uncharacterized protein YjiS (DUF1127 family)
MTTMMGLRAAMRLAAHKFMDARSRRRTARALGALPPHILKDIGLSGDYANLR